MEIEAIGSFLPNEELMGARLKYDSKQISRQELDAIENNAVRDVVERQIECGLHYITSGASFRHKSQEIYRSSDEEFSSPPSRSLNQAMMQVQGPRNI